MSFLSNVATCASCGAVAPQAGKSRVRVSTTRYVCSPACRRAYFEKKAGLSDTDVALMYAGSLPATVEISMDDLKAAGALREPDYREHLEMVMKAMNPERLSEGPFS